MKYFATFKNGKVSCSWNRETEDDHPSYIKKEDIHEIHLEQYENQRYLSLVDGEVQFDTVAYMQKKEAEIDAETARLIAKNAPNELELINDLLVELLDEVIPLIQASGGLFDNRNPSLKSFNKFIERREEIKAAQKAKKDAL